MKHRKLLIAMLSACFLASCTLATACDFSFGKNEESSVGSSVEESTDNTSQEGTSDSNTEEAFVEVVLDNKELSLDKYDTGKLNAIVYGSTAAVAWSSSNVSVATVDNNGNIVAVEVGEATITATVDGVSASCKVTVMASTTAPVISLSSKRK